MASSASTKAATEEEEELARRLERIRATGKSPSPVRDTKFDKKTRRAAKKKERRAARKAGEEGADAGMDQIGEEEEEEENGGTEVLAAMHQLQRRQTDQEQVLKELQRASASHSQAITELQGDTNKTRIMLGPKGQSGESKEARLEAAKRTATQLGFSIVSDESYGRDEGALLEIGMRNAREAKEMVRALGKVDGMWCGPKQSAYMRLVESVLGSVARASADGRILVRSFPTQQPPTWALLSVQAKEAAVILQVHGAEMRVASVGRHRKLREETARELLNVGGKGMGKGKTTLPWTVRETEVLPAVSAWLEQQFTKALSR